MVTVPTKIMFFTYYRKRFSLCKNQCCGSGFNVVPGSVSGLGISKLQFSNVFFFFHFWIRIRIHLNCWIRFRILIQSTTLVKTVGNKSMFTGSGYGNLTQRENVMFASLEFAGKDDKV
jgi:hypothetical protein